MIKTTARKGKNKYDDNRDTYSRAFFIGGHKVVIRDVDQIQSRTDGHRSLIQRSTAACLKFHQQLGVLLATEYKPVSWNVTVSGRVNAVFRV